MRGNLTQEVGPSHSPGGQSPLTHTHTGRKHSWCGGGISGVCVKGWVRGMGVTLQCVEEMKRITVHIRSCIQKAGVWR